MPARVTQQARQLAWTIAERPTQLRFLIRDRDSKFSRAFVDHYNSHRPHRSLDLAPPDPDAPKLHVVHSPAPGIERRDRLGGLIHEYSVAA